MIHFLVTLILLWILLIGLDSIQSTRVFVNRAKDNLKLVLVVGFTVWLLNGLRILAT